jgi:hypothetical protein
MLTNSFVLFSCRSLCTFKCYGVTGLFNYVASISDHHKVTHRGPWGCEIVEAPTLLDNRFTDDGEVSTLRNGPPFVPRKIPGTHLC